MSERQISVEALIGSYRDELAMQSQRYVEQQAYVRALENANADLTERLRKHEQPEQESAAPEADGEPEAVPAKAQQNGKANKASSARR